MDKQPYLKPGYYHDSTGSIFQVFGLVCHSETLNWLAVCGRNEPEWTQNWDEFYRSQILDSAFVPKYEFLNLTDFEFPFYQPSEKPHLQLGCYRHYKGTVYEVFDLVRCGSTEQWLVLYGKQKKEWARPYHMFFESVWGGSSYVPRFKYVPISDFDHLIHECEPDNRSDRYVIDALNKI